MWVGVYWKTTKAKMDDGDVTIAKHIWICLLPMFPIHIWWWCDTTILIRKIKNEQS